MICPLDQGLIRHHHTSCVLVRSHRRFIEVDNPHDSVTIESDTGVMVTVCRYGILKNGQQIDADTQNACKAALDALESIDNTANIEDTTDTRVSESRLNLAKQYRQEKVRLLREAISSSTNT